MNVLNLREPVSALTHGIWFLMILPAAVLLWGRAGKNRVRQAALIVYTLCLAFCALASTMYHAVIATQEEIAYYLLLDHIGIYLLIAGTYTPIAVILMKGAWQRWTLVATWVVAIAGIVLNLTMISLPNWFSTTLYLLMGWGALFCYVELASQYSQWTISPIWIGGVLYSIGALFHLFHWPVFWPGVIEAHDVFHVIVVAASAIHFGFILTLAENFDRIPCEPTVPAEATAARSVLSTSGASLMLEKPRTSSTRMPHIGSLWFRGRSKPPSGEVPKRKDGSA